VVGPTTDLTAQCEGVELPGGAAYLRPLGPFPLSAFLLGLFPLA
jgi:hypothetical protein